MEGILIPLGAFAAFVICYWANQHYKNRGKERTQDTICKAIDAGQQLNPETIKALGVRSMSSSYTDLRKAILFLGIGCAVLIFAQVIPDDKAPQIISGIAAFPIMLGIGYFIVYSLGLKEEK